MKKKHTQPELPITCITLRYDESIVLERIITDYLGEKLNIEVAYVDRKNRGGINYDDVHIRYSDVKSLIVLGIELQRQLSLIYPERDFHLS